MIAAGFQDPGGHTGGGGLAMGARHGQHPAIAQHIVVQPLRAGNVRDPLFQYRFNARITPRHGVTDDHQIRRRIQLSRIVTLDQVDPFLLQQRAHRRIDISVRAGHLMP
ncbi:hypothetical protein D3C76_1091870 [compost metagenome]